MCDPATIAIITAASTVAQGYAAKQQGDYAEGVANYNARIQENEAIQTRNTGTEAENAQREKTAQIRSLQRAQMGAANVDLSFGSAADILDDTSILGEADALRIRSNYKMKADSLDEQAVLTRAEGRAKKQAGDSAFAASILAAGAGVAGAGYAAKWFKPDSAFSGGTNFGLAKSPTSSSFGLR